MSSIISSRLPPEILQDIFKYNVEIKNRHARYKNLATSCLLVNRYWSMNAISLMWEEPLNICAGKEKSLEKILKVYVSNLPKVSKSLLTNLECQFEITLKQPTFNYASFLQKLELQSLYDIINRFILHKAFYSICKYEKTAKQRIDDNTALASLIDSLSTSPLKLTLFRNSLPIPQIINSLRLKLNNLTSLIIYECGSIPLETFQEYKKEVDELKDIIKYKSLSNLDEFDLCQPTVNNLHISSILQNTNNNLKVLKLNWMKSVDPENEELLFKSITENCTMLKELVISLTTSTAKYFPTCIRTLTHLQNLRVERYEDDQSFEEDMCIWAEALGKNISLSIKILSLDKNLNLNTEAFEKFLCQCYNR
ncbi:2327_t:CDS:2, partial [Cetraspora pellucida]